MKINLTYSVKPDLIPNFYYEVLDYYGLSAKNIKNSTIFIIKNILSSYTYDKSSDSYVVINNLHSNQQQMLDFANQAISICNCKAVKKFNKTGQNNKNEVESKDKPKELKQFKLYSEQIDKDTYFQIIDKSILENTIKIKESNSPYKDYTLVHSHLAQSVIHKVADDFIYYFKALKAYSTSKEKFTGRPKEPNYKSQNSRISFEISSQRFTNGGMIRILKNHKLYTDYDKTQLISKDLIEQFNSFNLLNVINQDIFNRNLSGKIVSIRVIPNKFNRKPKI